MAAHASRASWTVATTNMVLVGVGGVVGTAARYAVEEVVGAPGGWPWATLVVNVVGSFVLGLLLETLARRNGLGRAGDRVRLLVGTGMLGGFTTYSSFAVEAARLVDSGAVWVGVGYVGASLVGGLVAAAAGVAVAARGRRSVEASEPVDPDMEEDR